MGDPLLADGLPDCGADCKSRASCPCGRRRVSVQVRAIYINSKYIAVACDAGRSSECMSLFLVGL